VRLTFALPAGDDAPADLPVASCLLVKAPIGSDDGQGGRKAVLRPYTPTTLPGSKGELELVVKSYPTGVMSKHLASLKPGDSLDFKGPIAKFPYKPNERAHVGMIAGGTGITPMLQVIEHALRDGSDKTRFSLVFANVSEGDILLKKRLDALAAAHPSRLAVRYLVEKPSFGGIFWKGGVGRVTEEEVRREMPAPGKGGIVFVCGPPPMMNAVSGDKAQDKSQGELSGMLKKLGYDSAEVFKF
jgi:cytochrome-b5 reductase